MATEKLLTVRDVALILGISEREVIDLTENGKLPAYKVGGVYIRFKREHVEAFRRAFQPPPGYKDKESKENPFKDKVSDFFYFNDFYIVSFLIVIVILFIIFKG